MVAPLFHIIKTPDARKKKAGKSVRNQLMAKLKVCRTAGHGTLDALVETGSSVLF